MRMMKLALVTGIAVLVGSGFGLCDHGQEEN